MTKDEAIEAVARPADNHYDVCYSFAVGFISQQRGKFTSEDIIAAYRLKKLPEPAEPRVWGAVMNKLSKLGRITPVDWSTYKGKQGHGKPVRVWRTVQQFDNPPGRLIGGKQEKLF